MNRHAGVDGRVVAGVDRLIGHAVHALHAATEVDHAGLDALTGIELATLGRRDQLLIADADPLATIQRRQVGRVDRRQRSQWIGSIGR